MGHRKVTGPMHHYKPGAWQITPDKYLLNERYLPDVLLPYNVGLVAPGQTQTLIPGD